LREKYLAGGAGRYTRQSGSDTWTIQGTGAATGFQMSGTTLTKYSGTSASVTIPNNVTGIGKEAFRDCTSLVSVIISNSVTSIGDRAFYGCTSLASVTIGNSITSIGDYAFADCASLASVTIPNSVTSIGDGAFYGTKLTSITIPNSVTSIGDGAFYRCTSLTAINVTSGNTTYISENGVLYDKNKTVLINYPQGKTGNTFTIPNTVTSIEEYAFFKCTSLTIVTIPNSVTNIGEVAFQSCSNLASVNIPNNVITIGLGAFTFCTSLTSVTIPSSVKNIGYKAFDNTSLTSVTFQGTIISENLGVFVSGANTYIALFDGDLRVKYLAEGIGTYTTTAPVGSSSVWTKD